MKKILILIIILTHALIYNACDRNEAKKDSPDVLINESDVDQDATNFIKQASLSSIMEIKYGRAAHEKSNNAAVKSFAQSMITDHTKIYNEMKRLAIDKKILLPIELEQGQTDSLIQLQTLNGSNFDQNYMQLMVSGLQKSIKNFEIGSRNRDAAINTFSSENVKLLKEHLNSAILTYNGLKKNRS